VKFSQAIYEDRLQFLIQTKTAIYYYDRAGGGFSRLLDPDGVDWIAFRKTPLRDFPASAATGFRGLPNLLFGDANPDSGGGHPGFEKCRSERMGKDAIRTLTKSNAWAWRWDFTEQRARFKMETADPKHAWWFLYEGPIGGRFDPKTTFWATDIDGLTHDIPDISKQRFGHWKWAYFGRESSHYVLYLLRHQPDLSSDTLWFLGSQNSGAIQSTDGMCVFGFGRGENSQPQLRDSGQQFSIGFLRRTGHAALAAQLNKLATKR
jgi:hypothetical protein